MFNIFKKKIVNDGTQAVNSQLWKKIYSRVGLYWKVLVIAFIFIALGAATQPALAYIMKPLLDDGFNGAKPYYIWVMPTAIVVLIFFRGMFNFTSGYLLAWIANKVLLTMRADMFERLLFMSDSEYQKGDTGRLMNRFTIDAGNVTAYATEVFTTIIRESCVVLALLGMLFYLSWQLSLIIIFIFPLSIYVAQAFAKRLRKINRDTVNMNAQLTKSIKETIEGQRLVKLFNGYEYEKQRFSEINARLRRFAMRTASADAALTPLTQFCISGAIAAVVATALYQSAHGTLTVGSFVAFITALAQVFDPVKRLTQVVSKTQKMLVSAESVFMLIDNPSEQDNGTHKLTEPVNGTIRFDGVHYCFPNAKKNVINDISFEIKMGQTIAFVGRSGSGKTTLVNMIPRFVEPTAGAIYINDIDIRDLTLANLRSHLSFVNQNVVLFEGTVAENVGYGLRGTANMTQIRDALKAANLLDFIDSLPHGMHTKIGENGAWLSGGQRQRLAIARALIKNAPILILDEATSALDNESERLVQVSLDTLIKGRTTFVIAHRLSTVQNADRIIVLDDGKIIEQGSHDELLKNQGLYSSLYKMQFKDV